MIYHLIFDIASRRLKFHSIHHTTYHYTLSGHHFELELQAYPTSLPHKYAPVYSVEQNRIRLAKNYTVKDDDLYFVPGNTSIVGTRPCLVWNDQTYTIYPYMSYAIFQPELYCHQFGWTLT